MLAILNVVGLRLMGGIFGAWIDPLVRYTLIAAAGLALTIGAAQMWPRSGKSAVAVTQAVTQAAAKRDAIQIEHDTQEGADSDFVEQYSAQLAEWRRQAAARDSSAVVVISADDGWLRGKRAARSR
jgi:hypothetical protein